MKKRHFFLLTAALLLAFGCSKADEKPDPVACEADCLFVLENVEGKMVQMACFSRYGIQTANPANPDSSFIYAIPDVLTEGFEVPEKEVRFSAKFRANTLMPQFPDPSFDMGSLYQVDLLEIVAD